MLQQNNSILENIKQKIKQKFSDNPSTDTVFLLRNNEEFQKLILELASRLRIKIDWNMLSLNPNGIPLLEKNPDKIKWCELSLNPNGIKLLEQNLDKISWGLLSGNLNGIPLLEKNLDKINWLELSKNPNANSLLEQNPSIRDKIDWNFLSRNPNIFELDNNKLKEHIEPFKEELIKTCLHPKRLCHYLDKYNYDIGEEIFMDW